MYSVKQLAKLAGVSVRTLHYYDEIGLLKPSAVEENGYRRYNEAALFLLQQILFFREMDLSLLQIKQIIEEPGFDLVASLRTHRHTLQQKIERLEQLVTTVDATIMHLVGEVQMSKKQLFKGFSAEEEAHYNQAAMQEYGEDRVKPTIQLWNSYSQQKKDQIMAEGQAIYVDLIGLLDRSPDDPEVQATLERWHAHLHYFYEPSFEVLRGLGETYYQHPDFNATFTAMHPDLPAFLQSSILHYVDQLETAWLERELNILEE